MNALESYGRERETIGTNTLEYGVDDFVSRGVSLIPTLLNRVCFLSNKIGRRPEIKTTKTIREYLPQSGLENITVRVGHTRPLRDAYRLFSDHGLKDISFLGRVLVGLPATLLGGLFAKLTRSDHYNPFTKTVHVYSDIDAVALHELGHAQDFNRRSFPTIYSLLRSIPLVTLYQEGVASRHAHNELKEEDKKQTGRYLFPAFSSYVLGITSLPILPAIAVGHVAGYLFSKIKKFT